MKKIKYTILSFATISFLLLSAIETMAQKNEYTFERIEQLSPWLKSNNGAGLVFNGATENFSTVYGYYNNINGKFRNYNEPESLNNFGIATKSYSKLNKFYFYGMFNYDYTIRKNQSWLGTIYPNSTLAPIVENVPGKVLDEVYEIGTKIAYKANKSISAGISFDYKDATAAKRKDGRNKNTFSDLFVSPSVAIKTNNINLGLSLIYGYNKEKVAYKYIGDATGLYMYYMEGLFMYTSNTITSTGMILERLYAKNLYGASIQAELHFGKFSFYNDFTAKISRQNHYEESYFAKRYAYNDALEYDYKGVVRIACDKMEHNLNIGFNSSENHLYNITNIYEEISGENGLWEYFEYGNTLRYTSWAKTTDVSYNGLTKRSLFLPNIEYTLGFRFSDIEKTHKIYPSVYSQQIFKREYYAVLSKSFITNDKGYINAELNGAMSNGNGTPIEIVNPLSDGAIQCKEDLLAIDYAYNTSKKYNLGLSLKYVRYINKEKQMNMWIKGAYFYNKVSDTLLKFEGNNRNNIRITVGIDF